MGAKKEIKAKIKVLEADLATMRRALSLLQSGGASTEAISRRGSNVRPGTIPAMAQKVLKEAEKPLTGDQLVPLFIAQGYEITKIPLMNTIYRWAQKGKVFKVVARGTFGLLEWDESA